MRKYKSLSNLIYQFFLIIIDEFSALRHGSRTVPNYETKFIEILRYAPHLNMKKMDINKFMVDFNSNFCAKVRI